MSYQHKNNKKHKGGDKNTHPKEGQNNQGLNTHPNQQSMTYQPRPHGNSGTGVAGVQGQNQQQQQDGEALEKAARCGNDELINQLLENKSLPARQLNLALFAAVEGCSSTKSVDNHVACISQLLSAGAQINAEKKGKTILMIAAGKGYIELVSEILSRDAWVSHGDADSKTALHYAIDNKTENLDVVNLLIERGADKNKETTSDCFTPLIFAVNRGHKNITRILVEQGVKLDAQELNNGNTALHIACLNGQKDIVEILANENTFVQVYNQKNKNGQIPYDTSEEKVIDLQQEMLTGNFNNSNNLDKSTPQMQYRGQQSQYDKFQQKNNASQKEDKAENRWFYIMDYLDNLKTHIEDKAKNIGDHLINQELADEEKRQRKQDIENQQKAIAQAKVREKQNESKKQVTQQTKAIQQQKPPSPQLQTNIQSTNETFNTKNTYERTITSNNNSDSKTQSIDQQSRNDTSQPILQNTQRNEAHEKSSPKQKIDLQRQVDNSITLHYFLPCLLFQLSRVNLIKQNLIQKALYYQLINQFIKFESYLNKMNNKQINKDASDAFVQAEATSKQQTLQSNVETQKDNKFNNQKNNSAGRRHTTSSNKKQGAGQAQALQQNPGNAVNPLQAPSQQLQNKEEYQGDQPSPPAALNNVTANHNLMIQSNQQPVIINPSALQTLTQSQQEQLMQHAINQQQYGASLGLNGQNSMQQNNGTGLHQLDQNVAAAAMSLQNISMNAMNLNNLNQVFGNQQNNLDLAQLQGAGGNAVGLQQFGQPNQFVQNPGNFLAQQQFNQQLNQQLSTSNHMMAQSPPLFNNMTGDQNLSLMQQNIQKQNYQSHKNDTDNQNVNSQQNFNAQHNKPVGINNAGPQQLHMPVAQAVGQQSASSNQNLPIRLTLDFSDEKAQNLFIYEQKYNMKKNDCFNLEKQRNIILHELNQKNTEYQKLQAQFKLMNKKMQDLQQTQQNPANDPSNLNSHLSNVVQTQKIQEKDKQIAELKASHNEQLTMINHFKQMSEDKTKFSLEVVNKSMLAVDLIKKYKQEGQKRNTNNSKQEIDEVEEKIIKCQEAIQKDLIPTDPSIMVKNPLSLQFLNQGGNQQQNASAGTKNMYEEFQLHSDSAGYINQASNILEMEKRYETPLLQEPVITFTTTGNGATGQLVVQKGHEVQVIPHAALGLSPQTILPQQVVQVQSRHNFFEIQNILHNEILLFKQDANAILKEMQQVKEILVQRLTTMVSSLIPNYFVEVYGSHATGLCLHWSDIDLAVGQKQSENEKELSSMNLKMQDAKIKDALRKISDCLKSEIANEWVTQVNYIDQASVPVIKVKISLRHLMIQSGLPFPKNQKYEDIYNEIFSIDITHMTEMHNGVKCVNLVKEYLLDCWFIEPLILVLKQMLKVNGLNDPYKGGLSSYGLLLMIVSFIQFRNLHKVKVPGTINLGNILLDFLHYYGKILKFHEYGIMCRKPGDRNESSNNFYPRIPESIYQASTVPCIDDPLSPQNNVGKSTFQFKDIQKILKVGYKAAFMGCFCNCHSSNSCENLEVNADPTKLSNVMMQLSTIHPQFNDLAGSEPSVIMYQDENGNPMTMPVSNLYQQERILPKHKCDSILTKIIYSQAQFKAAEDNAQ